VTPSCWLGGPAQQKQWPSHRAAPAGTAGQHPDHLLLLLLLQLLLVVVVVSVLLLLLVGVVVRLVAVVK
jgi:hypothetical protein